MTQFLIVAADYDCGRGARWLNLHRFLTIFHGRRCVKTVSSQSLTGSRKLSCDTLFIGIPSDLTRDHLARLSYRRAVLFDYMDIYEPSWQQSNAELLSSLTDTYLKTLVDPHMDDRFKYGVLPIRRYAGLKLRFMYEKAMGRVPYHNEARRIYDVAFVGQATSPRAHNQRLDWLREIMRPTPRYKFWGGLTMAPDRRTMFEQDHGDLSDLYYAHRHILFNQYFSGMQRAKVALTPSGNIHWSYRHYEAIYAGAIPVSSDLSVRQALIPMPPHGTIFVPDGAPVTPAIERALKLRRESPEVVAENIAFLERLLENGDYSRRKPELMDRFMAQLED